jgi:hypothetical protein
VVVLALIVLASFLAGCLACVYRPNLPSLVLLAVLGVLWLRANGPIEGTVLVVFSSTHGLTFADLAVLAAVPAAWAYLRSRS